MLKTFRLNPGVNYVTSQTWHTSMSQGYRSCLLAKSDATVTEAIGAMWQLDPRLDSLSGEKFTFIESLLWATFLTFVILFIRMIL